MKWKGTFFKQECVLMQTQFPPSHDSAPHILTLPDARLRRVAEAVGLFGEDVLQAFTQLELAMRAGPGGVGIAAPQLGINRRMLTVDCSLARHPCRHHGLLQMANPVIVEHSEEKLLGREGCLSVPEWVGMVRRAKSVRVRFQDASGVSCEIEASGFEARVIQHEIDHLDGVLFIDRVVSTQDLVRRMSRP
jgi:peptide deformylase